MSSLVAYRPMLAGAEANAAPGQPYEYRWGCNGVFLVARREGLDCCIPLGDTVEVRGLAELAPFVALWYPTVPAEIVSSMLNLSRLARGGNGAPVEALFHLWWEGERWRLEMPEQEASGVSVSPLDCGPGSSYERALIEVHSHHVMPAFFSATDDAEEQGFRIYGVLGEIFGKPRLRVRIGVYGYHWLIPAEWIFELPDGVGEAVGSIEPEADIAMLSDVEAEVMPWD